MKRLVAVVAAIAMIAAAAVIRETVIEDDRPSVAGGDATLVCAEELPDTVCADGREEEVGAVFDRIVGGEAAPDIWLTAGPWPEIAAAARAVTGGSTRPPFRSGEVIASTRLVVVVKREPPQCAGAITWRCLGDAAQDDGVRIAAPSPATGVRLLIRAAFLTGYLDRSNYATNDFTDDPAAADWLAAVDRGIRRGRSFGATSLTDFLVKPGSADVFITTAAEVGQRASSSATEVVPTPVVRVDATIGAGDVRIPGELAEALRDAGWQVPPEAGVDDGLPSPGVLLALREES